MEWVKRGQKEEEKERKRERVRNAAKDKVKERDQAKRTTARKGEKGVGTNQLLEKAIREREREKDPAETGVMWTLWQPVDNESGLCISIHKHDPSNYNVEHSINVFNISSINNF